MRGAGLVEATAATRSLATIAPRLDRLVAGIRDRGCDAALLIGPTHAAHILAYQRVWSGPIAVIVAADGEITMLAPVYEVEAARGQCPTATVVGYGEPGFGLDLSSVQKMIPVAASRVGRGRLATASDLPGLAEAVAAEAGVEQVPIDDLRPDTANPRRISGMNVESDFDLLDRRILPFRVRDRRPIEPIFFHQALDVLKSAVHLVGGIELAQLQF
jgi:hypothetical protein